MIRCRGVGKKPTEIAVSYVQTDKRGNVLARLNELAAKQLGHSETREFGKCPNCLAWFELPNGGVRFHHTSRRRW